MIMTFEEKKKARKHSRAANPKAPAARGFRQVRNRLVCLGLYFAAGALALAAVTAPGATRSYGTGSGGDPVMVLAGPNDGEPINCRTVTPVLRTDYRAPATVAVFVNGNYHWSGPLPCEREDVSTGMVLAPIEVDLDAASVPKGQTGFEGPVSPVCVTVYLYDAHTSELVGSANWIGRVSRPVLENLGPIGGGSGSAPGRARALRLRPLPADVYFLVLSAGSREALRFSPEDPEAFRHAEVAAGGNCAEAGADFNNAGLTIAVESSSSGPGFFVLWTYDPATGWKSSAVLAVE